MTWRFSDDDGNTSGVKRCTLDVAGETPGGKRCAPDDSGEAPDHTGDASDISSGVPGGKRCVPDDTAGLPDDSAGLPGDAAGLPGDTGNTSGVKRCAPDDSGDAPGDSGDTPGDDRCMKINDLCKYDPKRPKIAVFHDAGEKLRSAGVLARSKVDISGDHENGRFLTLPRCCARGRARSGAGKKQACRRGGRSYS
jgi:hypothetical protein